MPSTDVADRFSVIALAVGLYAACTVSAMAADPSSELPAGGLVYAVQQTLLTKQEDIVIAADRITATYTIQNVAPEPRSVLMAYALPDLDMMALDGATIDNPAYDLLNPTNFVGFSALIDGQPGETFVEARALSLGLIDATNTLRELALPLYPLHPDMAVRLAALPETAKADLLARSLIRIADGQFEPQWSLKTTLFWQQPFAAGQVHQIQISYRPIAGAGPWTPETATALQQRYCIPAAISVDLTARKQPVAVKWVHFAASAGATARGPVATYRLAIDGTSTKQAVYSCRAGLAALGPATRREITQTEAVAEDEIQVLFIE